MYIDMCI